MVERQVLYLGVVGDSQQAAQCKRIAVMGGEQAGARQMTLFAEDRVMREWDCTVVQVRLRELSLHHPRPWVGCWLALWQWDRLALVDVLGEDFAVAHKDTLYRCLKRSLKHKSAIFSHPTGR